MTTAAKKKRNFRPKREQEALERHFGGLPVKDSRFDQLVVVDETDVKRAVPGDPTACGVAMGCKRSYGSTAVLIYKTVAYIDMPDDKGNRVVWRFIVPDATRAAIVKFDRTHVFPPGGFRLKAPTKSQRLEHVRKAARRRHRQVLAGERTVVSGAVNGARGDSIALEGVRSGVGMVHFTPKAS